MRGAGVVLIVGIGFFITWAASTSPSAMPRLASSSPRPTPTACWSCCGSTLAVCRQGREGSGAHRGRGGRGPVPRRRLLREGETCRSPRTASSPAEARSRSPRWRPAARVSCAPAARRWSPRRSSRSCTTRFITGRRQGNATGRNIHQRSPDEAVRLTKATAPSRWPTTPWRTPSTSSTATRTSSCKVDAIRVAQRSRAPRQAVRKGGPALHEGALRSTSHVDPASHEAALCAIGNAAPCGVPRRLPRVATSRICSSCGRRSALSAQRHGIPAKTVSLGRYHTRETATPRIIASRPISLRPPAEMFHVKHLYGTRVSLSSMLLACDVLSNALKSATCDVRRIKKRFSDHAVEEASLVPPSTTISIRRFPKQTKPFEKSFPARRRIPCLFVRKRPVFMRQPGSGPFHVAECIEASCVSRETSVRFVIRRSALQTLTCGDNRRLAADAAKSIPRLVEVTAVSVHDASRRNSRTHPARGDRP